jgi:hypothetical protein
MGGDEVSLDALARDPGRARGLSADERGSLIVQAAAVLAALGAGLTRAVETPQPDPVDRLLTAEEASTISGLTVRQLKTRKLPFRRRIGHRTLLFSERGLRAWLRRTS